ncbi:MAG: hypothetical protein AAF587_37475 [Bacteroidota bacterium]
MTTTTVKKQFLAQEVPQLLANLKVDTVPAFGLMTPQHMVEHLVGIAKYSMERNGEPVSPPTEGQLWFKNYIAEGAILQHRPSDKTKEDLPELRFVSLEEAISKVGPAIEAFYLHYETNPGFVMYQGFCGELSFDEAEHFMYSHIRYHLWQFGLIEVYP